MKDATGQHRAVRLGGELVWVSIGQGLAALGGLAGVRFLTEVLPPQAYGQLALGMSVVAAVQMSALQPLFEGSLRFFRTAADSGQAGALVAAVLRLTTRVALFEAAIALVAFALLAAINPQLLGVAVGVVAVSLISTWTVTISGLQNAARHRIVVAWHDGLTQWMRFGAAIVLILLFGPYGSVAIAGYAVGSAVVLASQMAFLRSSGEFLQSSPVAQRDEIRIWESKVRAYAWPFVTWGLAISAQIASARWALQFFGTSETVGLYSALHQAGYYPLVLLIGVLTQFSAPVIFRRAGPGSDPTQTNDARQLGWILIGTALAFTALATGIAALSHALVFATLVGPEYRSVSELLPWVVLGSGLFASGQAASVLGMVSADTRSLMLPRVGSALFGACLNGFGAWKYGLTGVVWAGVAYGAISCAWVAGAAARERHRVEFVHGA